MTLQAFVNWESFPKTRALWPAPLQIPEKTWVSGASEHKQVSAYCIWTCLSCFKRLFYPHRPQFRTLIPQRDPPPALSPWSKCGTLLVRLFSLFEGQAGGYFLWHLRSGGCPPSRMQHMGRLCQSTGLHLRPGRYHCDGESVRIIGMHLDASLVSEVGDCRAKVS